MPELAKLISALTSGDDQHAEDAVPALVDLGKEKNIKEHVKLILFRDGPVIQHPVTGRVLGSEPLELGEAKVKDVLKEFSKAIITRKTDRVKVLDKVITK